jgi:acetoin utilization protein AcuB|uniref:CBS domain-containing protein n=1 Tax=Desulfomonile tiedjei TaxID=2358 RepID=A0A7C4AU22_9BACT
MLVKDWMTKNVVTVNVSDSLQHAINTMIDNQVSILPVLEDGRLVGILTDRDVKRASPSSATLLDIQQALYQLARLEVGAVMSPHPITVAPDFTLEETAAILLERRISGAPVISKEGLLVGIITKSDVFKALLSLSGSTNKGLMFGFLIEDRPGSIKEVTDVVRSYGARLVSILTSYDRAPQGYRYLYIRLFNVDRGSQQEMKQELRGRFKVLYCIDQIENKREIYSD